MEKKAAADRDAVLASAGDHRAARGRSHRPDFHLQKGAG
jgi:hypothetical protein